MLVRSVIYRKNGWGFNFIRPFQRNSHPDGVAVSFV